MLTGRLLKWCTVSRIVKFANIGITKMVYSFILRPVWSQNKLVEQQHWRPTTGTAAGSRIVISSFSIS